MSAEQDVQIEVPVEAKIDSMRKFLPVSAVVLLACNVSQVFMGGLTVFEEFAASALAISIIAKRLGGSNGSVFWAGMAGGAITMAVGSAVEAVGIPGTSGALIVMEIIGAAAIKKN